MNRTRCIVVLAAAAMSTSVLAHTQYATEGFRQLGMSALEQTPRQRTFAGVGVDFARYGSMQLAWGMQTYYADAAVRTLGLNYAFTLGACGYVGVSATRSVATDAETTLLLSWTLPLGQRGTVGTAVQRTTTETGEELEGVAGKNYYYRVPGSNDNVGTNGTDFQNRNPDFRELEQIR